MTDKYTFTAGSTLPEVAEDVAPEIAFLTRTISPVLVLLGMPGGLITATNVIHEWQEDALLPNSTTIDGAQTSAETTLAVATGTGTRFVAGDVLQAEGSRELMSIDSGGVAASILTVTRGIRGTTAEAVTDGQVLRRMNNPPAEGETAPAARPTSRTRRTNYTEIFRQTASVTRSARKVKMLGNIDDELDRQVMHAILDQTRDLAHTVINGKQQSSNPEGTSSTARTMDGIIQSILAGSDPAVVDASSGALTETLLNNLLEDMFSKGALMGSRAVLAASPQQRRALSSLMESRQRFQPSDTRLGAVVDSFVSDFGVLDVLEPDTFIPNDALLVLDPAKVALAKLGDDAEPWEVLDLGQDGLVYDREVVGEFTLQIKNAQDGGHGMIHNLSFTAV